jgi:hypothetical protein
VAVAEKQVAEPPVLERIAAVAPKVQIVVVS